MNINKLYNRAKKIHGSLNRDVVHDMFVKFGQELPSDAYVFKCIDHAKPLEHQQRFEIVKEEESESFPLELSYVLSTAVNNVRDKYTLEVDTFLECQVNSSFKDFEALSGISRTVLEKICKFAKHEILKEYNRIKDLD